MHTPQTEAPEVLAFLETHLRPKVRVDGGDITLAEIDGDTIVIEAHADCAACPATGECLRSWLEAELSAFLRKPVTVRMRRNVPYYQR